MIIGLAVDAAAQAEQGCVGGRWPTSARAPQAAGLPGRRQEEGDRQPGAQAGRHHDQLRRRAARVRPALARPPPPFSRKFYTADDRPQLEYVVHNLEHGYTLLWYDDTVAKNERPGRDRSRRSQRSSRAPKLTDKFIALPWTSKDEDGKSLPEGHAHRADPLVRRRRPERRQEAAGRLAVLREAQRPGGQDLHEGVPLHGLARAAGRQAPRVVPADARGRRPRAARRRVRLSALVPLVNIEAYLAARVASSATGSAVDAGVRRGAGPDVRQGRLVLPRRELAALGLGAPQGRDPEGRGPAARRGAPGPRSGP